MFTLQKRRKMCFFARKICIIQEKFVILCPDVMFLRETIVKMIQNN